MDPKITEENGRRVYHWAGSHLEREDDDKQKRKTRRKRRSVPTTNVPTFS